MSHREPFPPAPLDEACTAAWDRIMAIAREHCLVASASGGVAALAVPEEQRAAGIRDRVLAMHRMSEPVEVTS
jgi:hypothetical protein